MLHIPTVFANMPKIYKVNRNTITIIIKILCEKYNAVQNMYVNEEKKSLKIFTKK